MNIFSPANKYNYILAFFSGLKYAVKYVADVRVDIKCSLDKIIKKIPCYQVGRIPLKIFLNLNSPLSNRSGRLWCN